MDNSACSTSGLARRTESESKVPVSGYTRTAVHKQLARQSATKHGHTEVVDGKVRRSPTYTSWQSMIARCRYPSVPSYKNYGGRGISVCERWMKLENFLADMGERPSSDYQVDRIDNDGNYEPGNCRWLTRSENVAEANRRRKKVA